MVVTCICTLGGGEEELNKRTMFPHSTSVSKKAAPPSPLPEARQFHFFPYVPSVFQAAAPALELKASDSISEQLHSCLLYTSDAADE